VVTLVAAVNPLARRATATRLALANTGLSQKLGVAVFLPVWLGWAGAIFVVIVVMAAWAAFATWNEATERFSLGA
jgi:fatty acid desaturase